MDGLVIDYVVVKGDQMESDDFQAVLKSAGYDSSEINFKSK